MNFKSQNPDIFISVLFFQVRQFIEMVSGADTCDTDGHKWGDTSTSTSSSDHSQMDTLDTDNHDNNLNGVNNVNNANSTNGNVESEHVDNMEVETTPANRDNSILSNPARFDSLIR